MNAALLVGINQYREPGNDLRGCINDVLNMKDLLIHTFNFSVLQISELTDSMATTENILNGLKKLVQQAKAGDHLLFHFSGHGSQVPDQNNDEEDFMDEIICPYDLDWNGLYVSDDDLRLACSQLHAQATLDVILDSCHSGTGLRIPGEIPKFIPSPFIISLKACTRTFGMVPSADLPNVVLWSGCTSTQTSSDAYIDKKSQGAMTWAFGHAARTIVKSSSSRDWHIKMINRMMVDNGYTQTPQLEGTEAMKQKGILQ